MAKKKEKETLEKIDKEDIKGRDKALKSALSQIEKDFGKGSIMRLGDYEEKDLEVISTGNLAVDLALGVGGIPKGRIVEIYGPESSGKTTLALHIVAEAQKAGGEAAFIDAEHALDPIYARNLGVNIDKLLVSQPDNGEQALEITEALARSGAIDLIVVDSVAALVPKAEIDGMMGDSHMAIQARLMSQALRKLTGVVSKMGTTIIFINQLREKVGIMFGNPEVTPGGRALKFYSSVRIDIRKREDIKQGDSIIGNMVKIKIVKNKVAPPFKEVMCEMIYGEGLSPEGTMIDLASDFDVLTKSGSWYSYGDTRIGQGKDKVKAYLNENPEIKEEIIEKVKQKAKEELGFGMPKAESDDNEESEVEEVTEEVETEETK